jgi:CoA:oxalate CoA-transferase
VIGCPGLDLDQRFATDSARTIHEPELRALIETWSLTFDVAKIMEVLNVRDIPCAPIRSFGEAANSGQTVARRLVTELDHPRLGVIKVVGQPVVFDGIKPLANSPAPDLGHHARRILSSLSGYDERRIDDLLKKGVLVERSHAEHC